MMGYSDSKEVEQDGISPLLMGKLPLKEARKMIIPDNLLKTNLSHCYSLYTKQLNTSKWFWYGITVCKYAHPY